MLGKRKIENSVFSDQLSRVVAGTVIKGDITSQSDFRLDGELIGNFTSSGKIVIGATGNVKGNISCVNLDIEGVFEGKIEVEDLLNVKSTGVLCAEIVCRKLSVELGAVFKTVSSIKTSVDAVKNSNIDSGKLSKTATEK
jgi:cytoskeletal protein CcmA (bactofilin family)